MLLIVAVPNGCPDLENTFVKSEDESIFRISPVAPSSERIGGIGMTKSFFNVKVVPGHKKSIVRSSGTCSAWTKEAELSKSKKEVTRKLFFIQISNSIVRTSASPAGR